MSIATRVFEVANQVAMLQASVPAANDYPARCEVSNAVDGLFSFTIGNLKGLASPVAQLILIVCAFGLIIAGGRSNSNKFVRGIMFALGGLLLLAVIVPLVNSFGPGAC